MEGLKQQLEKVKAYDQELQEMIEEAGFEGTVDDNDIGEFLEWKRETDEPYNFVSNKFNWELYALDQALSTITGQLFSVGDEVLSGNYEAAEREIEAAYRLSEMDEVKA